MECDLLNARTKDETVPGVYLPFPRLQSTSGWRTGMEGPQLGRKALEALGQVPGNVDNVMVTAMQGRTET